MHFDHLIRKARPFINVIDCRQKHFSFILDGKKIVSFGHNTKCCTHPLANKYGYWNASIHAELDAIKRFRFKPSELKHCILVNIRFMADNKLGMSKPCPKCQRLLKDFELREVWYSDKTGNFVKLEA